MEHVLAKATHQQTRDHNTRLVFRTIYDEGEISRAELARRTGLTRTTVSAVAGDLIQRGLVEETGTGQFSGGRLPIMLRAVEDARYVLALRLDSAAISGAAVSLRGAVHHRVALPLADHRVETLLAQLCRAIDMLAERAGRPILGIGLGMPGVVDPTRGVVRRAVNFGLTDLPLRRLVEERYGLPVYLGNEVHLAALAEYSFGAGAPGGSLVAISVSIGVGAGIVLAGELFHGDSYGAGEIGHVVVEEGGRPCKCGNRGCLETVASTAAILREARELALREPDSALGRLAAGAGALDLELLRQAIEAGDPGAAAIVVAAGRYLGITLAHVVGLLNIERIVLTGPAARLGRPLQEAVAAGFARRVLAALAERTRVELLPEEPDAVLLGAAALLIGRELGLLRVGPRHARHALAAGPPLAAAEGRPTAAQG